MLKAEPAAGYKIVAAPADAAVHLIYYAQGGGCRVGDIY
jgi:hypothetical protein